MIDDPVSDVLALVGARSAFAGGFVAGGRWAIRFPPPAHVKFFVVARGTCLITIDGEAASMRLGEGDVFLLAASRSFLVASGPGVAPLAAAAVFADGLPTLKHVGEGEELLFFGGHVTFASAHASIVIDGLPPFLHLSARSEEAATLTWLVQRLTEEARGQRPGAAFAKTQLAQLMFLELLRACLAEPDVVAGRLRVLGDPRLAPALRRMHAEPARPWQLDELAKLAGMSRTAFAVYFKSVAGVAPLTYLTEWRMRLAERELRASDATFAELASVLGYASESAFSTAFKRVNGVSPKFYRSRAREALGERAMRLTAARPSL